MSELSDLLDRLAALLPPPQSVPYVDWMAHAHQLGCELPADFKAFHERWGTGGVQDSAFTIEPPGLSSKDWLQDELRTGMHDSDVERRPVYPAPGGLLGFASTESTKWWLFWETATWTVVIHTFDGFQETGLAFVPWFVGALAGELAPRLIPEELQPYQDEESDPPPGIAAGPRGHWWCHWPSAPR